VWGCVWFKQWKQLVQKAYYKYKQQIVVYFFQNQVGQGMVDWAGVVDTARMRDEVLNHWPKDGCGWLKKLTPEEEDGFLATLSPEQRHSVAGLGGSQKAEVAWLLKEGIPFESKDVSDFVPGRITQIFSPTIHHPSLAVAKSTPDSPEAHFARAAAGEPHGLHSLEASLEAALAATVQRAGNPAEDRKGSSGKNR
jgi:hypothetical protein